MIQWSLFFTWRSAWSNNSVPCFWLSSSTSSLSYRSPIKACVGQLPIGVSFIILHGKCLIPNKKKAHLCRLIRSCWHAIEILSEHSIVAWRPRTMRRFLSLPIGIFSQMLVFILTIFVLHYFSCENVKMMTFAFPKILNWDVFAIIFDNDND